MTDWKAVCEIYGLMALLTGVVTGVVLTGLLLAGRQPALHQVYVAFAITAGLPALTTAAQWLKERIR